MKNISRYTSRYPLFLTSPLVVILVFFVTSCQDPAKINLPPDGVIDSPANNVIMVAGGAVNFQGNGADPDSEKPLSFKWEFSGGAHDSTQKDPGMITFKTPGTFKVTFTVTDDQGLSDPEPATVMVEVVHVFAGYDFVSGSELWITDGTEAGTKMVKDINAFRDALAYPNLKLTNVNGTTFFVASDGIHGYELWKTDGTEEGTMMVKDINHDEGSAFDPYATTTDQANKFTSVNGIIFFIANDGTNGYGLWKSDGTGAGTTMVKDINPSQFPPYSLNDEIINFHGTIFFAEDNGISGRELWKSDGTEAGTILVKDTNPGSAVSNPHNFTAVGGTLFFIAYDSTNGLALWKSDGTEDGTAMVKIINPSMYPSPDKLTDVNGTLFFVFNDEIHGQELWKSDGTGEGTVLVKDIHPAGDSNPSELTNVNGTLFFTANDGTNGRELWKSDGTEEGTVMINDLTPGPETFKLQALTPVNGILYFIANNHTTGDGLWRSDGTKSGTFMVKDFNPDGESFVSDNFKLINVNGTLYFLANWIELWKSDGTEAGTVKIMNINTMAKSSLPFSFAEHNDMLFFKASDGTETGSGLWTSNGTEEGTVIIKNTGIQSEFVHVEDTLFFVSYDEVTGRELWMSDGTEEGTVLVKDINPAGDSGPSYLTTVNGILYFSAFDRTNGEELWKSDGTEAGTVMVKDIYQGFVGSYPHDLLNMNEILFFMAYDGINGHAWWKYDGKDAEMVPAGGDFPPVLDSIVKTDTVAISDPTLFIGYDSENGVALWKSDGTSAGTAKVKNIFFPSEFNFNWNADIIDVNGTLFFIVYAETEGIELWKSDGTEAGTVKIKDINDNGSSFYTSYYSREILTSVNGTLFFTADDGVSGVELWKSDGTEGGTIRVKDINPGTQDAFYCLPYPYTSTPDCFAKLTSTNDNVFFWANDGTHGYELWKSDGTESGTIMVKDIYPDSGSSFYSVSGFFTDLINFNDTLFFSANDGINGFELWKSDGTEAGTIMVKDININNQ